MTEQKYHRRNFLWQNEEELLKNLNEQEKIFNKLKSCYDEMIQITECQAFIKGFKLGARFFMKWFENDADIFDEWNSSMSAFYVQNPELKEVFNTVVKHCLDDNNNQFYKGIDIILSRQRRSLLYYKPNKQKDNIAALFKEFIVINAEENHLTK